MRGDLSLPCHPDPETGRRLAEILKGLRRRRGLRVQEAADRMGLAKRTYEAFEAGDGSLNLGRIQAFADALDVDAIAIVLGLVFRSADLAFACADNKLMHAALLTARDFDRDTGPDLARLDARVVFRELDGAWTRLRDEARRRRPSGLPS